MELNVIKNEEFKKFCGNYKKVITQKEIEFTDFICFILGAVIEEETLGFINSKDYNDENFEEGCQYSFDEEHAWKLLFELTKTTDLDDLEERFLSYRWQDNDNTAIIRLNGRDDEFFIMRM